MNNPSSLRKSTDKEKMIIKIAKKIDEASSSSGKPLPILQRSEIQDVSRYLKESLNLIDILTDKLSSVTNNFNKALNKGSVRKKFQEPPTPRVQNTYQSRPLSVSSSNNSSRLPSTSANQSPLSHASALNKRSRDLRQNSFTPNPYASANTRRRSSHIPLIEEPMSDDSSSKPIRRNIKQPPTVKTNSMSRNSRRTSEASRLPSPSIDSTSNTPTRENVTFPRPTNNRLSVIKDSSLGSPASSATSPLSSGATDFKPDEDVLIKVINQQDPSNYSASHFQDHRERDVSNNDFSKSKGTFSTAAATFQTYAEAFLRPLNIGDLIFIQPQELDTSTLNLPPVKKKVHKPWLDNLKDYFSTNPPKKVKITRKNQPLKKDFLENRIISLFVDDYDLSNSNPTADKKSDEFIVVDEISPEECHKKLLSSLNKKGSNDSRALNELARLDILPFNVKPQLPYDPISLALKTKQLQFKELHNYNNSKRQHLDKIAREHMASLDYNRYIDNLDSKLEQAYVKRQNIIKSRRKKTANFSRSVPEGVPDIVKKRGRAIKVVSKIFDPMRLLLPSSSVYANIRCPPILVPDVFPEKEDKTS